MTTTEGLRRQVGLELFKMRTTPAVYVSSGTSAVLAVVAAATAILVASFLPHGDEEIKEILVGSLLTVSFREVGVTAAIFAVLGGFHFALRKKFLALSFEHDAVQTHDETWREMAWDLAFYMSFGVVIASSVQMAGVLLVFSFLIVPAVFSALFTHRLGLRLVMGWALGAVVSAAGLFASFRFDLPTGAAVVVTFGVALMIGAVARVVLTATAKPSSVAPAAAPGSQSSESR